MTRIRTIAAGAVAAAAVCLAAATAGPAAAATKDDDLLKALAGVAAVAVFAGLITQQQRNRDAALPVPPALPAFGGGDPRWRDSSLPDEAWRHRRADDRGGPRLPAACAFDIGNPSRPTTFYADSCLRREGLAYGLPQYCAQQLRSREFRGRAFDAECLLDAGYREERWR